MSENFIDFNKIMLPTLNYFSFYEPDSNDIEMFKQPILEEHSEIERIAGYSVRNIQIDDCELFFNDNSHSCLDTPKNTAIKSLFDQDFSSDLHSHSRRDLQYKIYSNDSFDFNLNSTKFQEKENKRRNYDDISGVNKILNRSNFNFLHDKTNTRTSRTNSVQTDIVALQKKENYSDFQNTTSKNVTSDSFRKFSDELTTRAGFNSNYLHQKEIIFKTEKMAKSLKSTHSKTHSVQQDLSGGDFEISDRGDKKSHKLIKNRMSAKKSRHKKKIYIQNLEKRLGKTQDELEHYKLLYRIKQEEAIEVRIDQVIFIFVNF